MKTFNKLAKVLRNKQFRKTDKLVNMAINEVDFDAEVFNKTINSLDIGEHIIELKTYESPRRYVYAIMKARRTIIKLMTA